MTPMRALILAIVLGLLVWLLAWTLADRAELVIDLETVDQVDDRQLTFTATVAPTTTMAPTTTTTAVARSAPKRPGQVTRTITGAGDVWHRLAMCETGGKMNNPNTGNGYYGYFQFDLQTWRSVGGPGHPHHHSYDTQRSFAQRLQAARGWSPWPTCARKLGLL